MSLNCNEINEVLAELDLEGAFIQDIVQPGYDTLALYTYGKNGARTVLVCIAQNVCRIHETRRKIAKNDKPLRFMEFLKSRIKGARIDSCIQLGLQRIVKIRLSHEGVVFILYIRLWSGAANIILCDENNLILDTMYRRPGRNEMTGCLFVIPAEKNIENNLAWSVRGFDEIKSGRNLSFNEKVDIWYGEYAQNLSREALLKQAERWYSSARSRMEVALEKLEKKRGEFLQADVFRHHGDLIMANMHLVQPQAKFLECEDFSDGHTVRIMIDPEKTVYENAAVYYDNYKKAVSGTEALEHDIELSKRQLEKLDSLYAEILNERNPVRIEQLFRRNSTPRQRKKKSHPGLDYNVNGWYILVGRDSDENDELLRHHVRGSDVWLHVRDFPGGYVFIKSRPGKTVPLEILLDAANLAVYYSKARNAGKTDLYYTYVKYLRRAKNGPKGLVLPAHEKNLCITPDKERLARLDGLHKETELDYEKK